LSHPTATRARVEAPRIRIASVDWERVQVTLRVCPVDGRLDPASVRLRYRPGSASDAAWSPPGVARTPGAPTMPPTRAWQEDADLLLRFNVMQGPGRVPLVGGRWVLEGAGAATSPAGPLRIEEAPAPDPGRSTARFELDEEDEAEEGTYVAAARVDPVDGSFGLDITLLPPAGRSGGGSIARRTAEWTGYRLGRIRLGLFVAVFHLCRVIARRNGRRILFTSDSRAELGDNLKFVWDRMVERGLDRRYEMLTLLKPSITARRRFLDRLRLPWMLARADVIVIDDYHPVIYRLDERDARIVQLWHAWGAFKTVGYSRVGKPGGLSPWSRVHKNYSIAIVSSEDEVAPYAEAFGIPEDRVRPTGLPRMDRFFGDRERETARDAALAAYPATRDRRVILFAPTFRGAGARTAWYDLDLIDYDALHRVCAEQDAVCIIRMHPFVTTPLRIPEALRDRLIDGSGSAIDVNTLLFAVDLLITDYSSIVFEFSTLDRPMLFFADDLEEYVASRDFYVRYEDFVPGRIVRTFDDLLDAIRREDFGADRLAAFRAAHLDHFDGHATDRVIDLIVGT
jgi:CDP-glycerol glycerophosphotransferase (TagB/SpsB family)